MAYDRHHAARQLMQEAWQESTMPLVLVSSQALVGRGQLRQSCRRSPLDWSVRPLLLLQAALESMQQLGRFSDEQTRVAHQAVGYLG